MADPQQSEIEVTMVRSLKVSGGCSHAQRCLPQHWVHIPLPGLATANCISHSSGEGAAQLCPSRPGRPAASHILCTWPAGGILWHCSLPTEGRPPGRGWR